MHFWQDYPGLPFYRRTRRLLMSGSAARVLITERQQEVLHELVAGRTTPVRLVQRATIVLRAFAKVGRYLREAELQPHRSKYWLNTKEKDPARFQAKVEEVCDCYLEAPRLYAEEATHTVCTDEMTGIQALERIAPTLPPGKGRTE